MLAEQDHFGERNKLELENLEYITYLTKMANDQVSHPFDLVREDLAKTKHYAINNIVSPDLHFLVT